MHVRAQGCLGSLPLGVCLLLCAVHMSVHYDISARRDCLEALRIAADMESSPGYVLLAISVLGTGLGYFFSFSS